MNKAQLIKKLEEFDDEAEIKLAVYGAHHGKLDEVVGGLPGVEDETTIWLSSGRTIVNS